VLAYKRCDDQLSFQHWRNQQLLKLTASILHVCLNILMSCTARLAVSFSFPDYETRKSRSPKFDYLNFD